MLFDNFLRLQTSQEAQVDLNLSDLHCNGTDSRETRKLTRQIVFLEILRFLVKNFLVSSGFEPTPIESPVNAQQKDLLN